MALNLKSFAAGMIVATIGVSTAFAAGGIKSAAYNSNKIMFDGKELDISGAPMISVVKEGETYASNYMPVRAVLEAMGYEVYWDSAAKTVLISSEGTDSDTKPAEKLFGYWICEDESALIKYSFTEDGNYALQTTDKQASPPTTSHETGTFTVERDSNISFDGKLENGEPAARSLEIAFGIDNESWSYGTSDNLKVFTRDTGDTGWADGTSQTMANMPNPWETCTEEEAFAYLGAKFKIEPPAGYELSGVATLSEQFAEEAGKSARFVYTNDKGEMFRVHINPGSAKALPEKGEPVKANGLDAYYNKEECSVSYAQGENMITIDMPEKSKDELLKTVGSVTLVK